MTEQELQAILNNMDLEELKKLQTYYREYEYKTNILKNAKKRLNQCQKIKLGKLKPSKRELEVKANLNLALNLPSKFHHSVDASLSNRGQINKLVIDNQSFHLNTLDNDKYFKMFLETKNTNIVNNEKLFIMSILLMIISTISLTMTLLNLPSVILFILQILLLVSTIYTGYKSVKTKKTTFKNMPKSTISQFQLKQFIKELKKDYIKEKENSKTIHENNLAFNASIEDIFKNTIETNSKQLERIVSEIRKILKSKETALNLTKEEIIDTNNIIKKHKQKTYKL